MRHSLHVNARPPIRNATLNRAPNAFFPYQIRACCILKRIFQFFLGANFPFVKSAVLFEVKHYFSLPKHFSHKLPVARGNNPAAAFFNNAHVHAHHTIATLIKLFAKSNACKNGSLPCLWRLCCSLGACSQASPCNPQRRLRRSLTSLLPRPTAPSTTQTFPP